MPQSQHEYNQEVELRYMREAINKNSREINNRVTQKEFDVFVSTDYGLWKKILYLVVTTIVLAVLSAIIGNVIL